LGICAARNKSCAIGANTKTATKRLTPLWVTNAPASTTVSIARPGPNRSVMNPAMAETEPLSSISLPKSAPSREQREELRDKTRSAVHESLRPVGE
jgi:hypothetical protein